MDAELEFAIQPNTTGKQLFDQVSLIPQSMQFCVLVCVWFIYVCPLWCVHAEAR